MGKKKFKNLRVVEKYADKLIAKTYIIDGKKRRLKKHRFTFMWMHSKTAFGECHTTSKRVNGELSPIEKEYGRNHILLSKHFVNSNLKKKVIKKVLLHEIAHGLHYCEGNNPSHDARWKHICLSIGGDGITRFDAQAEKINVPKMKYYLECPECKTQTQRRNKTAVAAFRCSDCKEVLIQKQNY